MRFKGRLSSLVSEWEKLARSVIGNLALGGRRPGGGQHVHPLHVGALTRRQFLRGHERFAFTVLDRRRLANVTELDAFSAETPMIESADGRTRAGTGQSPLAPCSDLT